MDEPVNTAGKQRGRQFQPGQSGNPDGKPKGARHRVTRAIEELLEGQHEALTQVAIDKALQGDMTALRLCLDRIAPPRKDAPISIDLPDVRSAEDAVAASKAVLGAVSAGDVTPDEGGRVMALLTAHKAIVETGDLEKRIAALETKGVGK
ncbi:MAG: DUF5681 domain-containing protein [Sphingomonadaceae bacterium]